MVVKADTRNWNKAYAENERRATITLQGSKLSEKEWLDKTWQRGQNILLKIKSLIDLKKGSKILDLGCGSNGRFLIPGIRMGITSFGADISDCALGKLAKRIEKFSPAGDITVCQSDAARFLPFKDSVFDVVLSSGMVCHTRDLESVVEEAARVIKPGGVIYISGFLNKKHPAHFSYACINGWKKRIGFDIIYYYYCTVEQIDAIFCRNNLAVVKWEEVHEFIPFYETILYPDWIMPFFNLMQDKFIKNIPNRWSVYAVKSE